MLKIAPMCTACALDFSGFNVGDGGAAFGTLIVGALVAIGGVTMQVRYDPPVWLQLAIWLPVAVIATVALLRVANAALLGAEYRNAAREGKIQP